MNEIEVSGKDLAAIFGIGDRYIRELADRGTIRRVGRGKYLLLESVQSYTTHLRDMASGRGDGQSLDLAAERARLAKEQADGHELKNKQARGDLLQRAEVEREWGDILRKVRSGILSCTSRIKGRLPHLTVNDGDIIDRELRDALTALANDDETDTGEGASGAATAATT